MNPGEIDKIKQLYKRVNAGMKIEVGKTYATRDGKRITIEAETNYHGTYRMQGIDEQGRVTWRSRKGRFDRHPSSFDLVREVHETD